MMEFLECFSEAYLPGKFDFILLYHIYPITFIIPLNREFEPTIK
jgi:hypothetical protein